MFGVSSSLLIYDSPSTCRIFFAEFLRRGRVFTKIHT